MLPQKLKLSTTPTCGESANEGTTLEEYEFGETKLEDFKYKNHFKFDTTNESLHNLIHLAVVCLRSPAYPGRGTKLNT